MCMIIIIKEALWRGTKKRRGGGGLTSYQTKTAKWSKPIAISFRDMGIISKAGQDFKSEECFDGRSKPPYALPCLCEWSNSVLPMSFI